MRSNCILSSGCVFGLLLFPSTALKTDCQWYDLRQATVLWARASQAASSADLSLLSRLADAKAHAKADEMSSTLDDFGWEAERGRTKAGECFGESDYGKEVAEKYAWVKGEIVERRMAVKEALETALATNKAMEEEEINFERWRADNQKSLVRDVGGMRLEIVRIARRDILDRPGSNTVIAIEATNTTASRILKPKNQIAWGLPSIGATLTDPFGNDYNLTSITPQFRGDESKGIRPGQTVTFELRFGDTPLENAKSVRLAIEAGTFGQSTGTAFDLPLEAFHAPS